MTERRIIFNTMAPNLNKGENLLLEVVNLSRKATSVKNMNQLIDLRSEYLEWLEKVKELLIVSESVNTKKILMFLRSDLVQSDFLENGGAGIDFEADRAKYVLKIIKEELSKRIDYLGNIDLDDKTKTYYKSENKTLYFKNKEIKISERAENYPAELLNTLFKKPAKDWATDEILEDWYGVENNDLECDSQFKEALKSNRVYQAGLAVNQKIAQKTQYEDFLDVTKKQVRINQKYLNKSL